MSRPRLKTQYQRERLCYCGRKAMFRLRVRQLDPELELAHRVYLYLCASCYRLELETCENSDLSLPRVTPVVLNAWLSQFERLYPARQLLPIPESLAKLLSRHKAPKPAVFASIRLAQQPAPYWSVLRAPEWRRTRSEPWQKRIGSHFNQHQ